DVGDVDLVAAGGQAAAEPARALRALGVQLAAGGVEGQRGAEDRRELGVQVPVVGGRALVAGELVDRRVDEQPLRTLAEPGQVPADRAPRAGTPMQRPDLRRLVEEVVRVRTRFTARLLFWPHQRRSRPRTPQRARKNRTLRAADPL